MPTYMTEVPIDFFMLSPGNNASFTVQLNMTFDSAQALMYSAQAFPPAQIKQTGQ